MGVFFSRLFPWVCEARYIYLPHYFVNRTVAYWEEGRGKTFGYQATDKMKLSTNNYKLEN